MTKSREPVYLLAQNEATKSQNNHGKIDIAHNEKPPTINPAKRSVLGSSVYILRHRKGVYITAWVLTFGILFLISVILEILHISDPHRFKTLGTLNKFGGLSSAMGFFTSVAGVLVATAGAVGNLSAGVLRSLVATGRSRMSFFFSDLVAVILVMLQMIVPTLVIFGVASYLLRSHSGFSGVLSFAIILRADLWVLLEVFVWTILAFGFANLFGSRSIAIGVTLLGELIITSLLSAFSSYPGWRQAFVGVTLRQIMPTALQPGVSLNRIETGWQAAIVIVLWVLGALFLGARRAMTREL
ncbi:MAG: hypothetical protein M1374_06535 [Firmicutes bacterium]|jgi:hypothetical protein|nr:hypothetical protein [Bacillota bacterium]